MVDLSTDMTYRDNIITAYELETGNTISPEVKWSDKDIYFEQNNKLYYNKIQLLALMTTDAENPPPDIDSIKLGIINDFLGYSISDPYTLDDIRNIIELKPAGLPMFIEETPEFFIFRSVGTIRITIDNVNQTMLNRISTTFSSDVNPLLSYLDTGIFDFYGQLYYTNILEYMYNPNGKLGAYFQPSSTVVHTGYTENNFFLPFTPLTGEQLNFILNLDEAYTEYLTSINIINI